MTLNTQPKQQKQVPPFKKHFFFPLLFLQKIAKIAPIRTKKKLCEATNTVARSVQHGLGELRW